MFFEKINISQSTDLLIPFQSSSRYSTHLLFTTLVHNPSYPAPFFFWTVNPPILYISSSQAFPSYWNLLLDGQSTYFLHLQSQAFPSCSNILPGGQSKGKVTSEKRFAFKINKCDLKKSYLC